MKKYILKRVLISILTLLTIMLILFILLHSMPGSPFNDEKLSASQKAILYEKYGLDKPVLVQFFTYIINMLKGDLGVSYNISKNTPISALLKSCVSTSFTLGIKAMFLGTFLGLFLGILSAVRKNSIWDSIGTAVSVLGVSVPSYVFALGLSYVFACRIKLFPTFYQTDNIFYSSILPTLALSLYVIAYVTRFTRNEMVEVLESDYMLFAQTKGLSAPRLIFSHAIRNVLNSLITVLGPLMVFLMTGSVVVEKIFSIPGIGNMLVTAIQQNDYNVIFALSFLYSTLYIAVMLIIDILYGIIDPRIRLSGESEHD